jgi:hypothetical protein
MTATLEKELIAVDRVQLETLIGKGKLEVEASVLATLCLFAEANWWISESDKNVYAPMCEAKALLLARGRGEV